MKRPGSLPTSERFCCDGNCSQGRNCPAVDRRTPVQNERAWRVVVDVICTILVVGFLSIAAFGGFKP
jgi:hypothetical protein